MRLNTVEQLARHLLGEIESQASGLIFAQNATGKTRLSQQLSDDDPEGVVLYNSYVEDLFAWDDDQVALKLSLRSPLLSTIKTQGLDKEILENFSRFTDSDIEPTIDFENEVVTFGVHTGDERAVDGIKISRAEESIFIWCVYYTVLKEAISERKLEADLRSTDAYDNLKLAVIDDPVSSMDDVRVVSVALAIADIVKSGPGAGLKFVITTHHPLFFSVLFSALRSEKSKAFVLRHEPRQGWKLELQSKSAPFSYHLGVIQEIQQAISEDVVNRAHLNQFRSLLEKTANFLGYTNKWDELLTGPEAKLMISILNIYSHDGLWDIEHKYVSREHAKAFSSEFEIFLTRFRWKLQPDKDAVEV